MAFTHYCACCEEYRNGDGEFLGDLYFGDNTAVMWATLDGDDNAVINFYDEASDVYVYVAAEEFLVGTPVDEREDKEKGEERDRLVDDYRKGKLREGLKLSSIPTLAKSKIASFKLAVLVDWNYEMLLYLLNEQETLLAKLEEMETNVPCS